MDGLSFPSLGKAPAPAVNPSVTSKLREQLKQNPSDVKTRVQLAAALDSAGNASEAEDVLRSALQRGQKTSEVFRALGNVYLRNQVLNGAVDAYTAAARIDPKNVEAHFRLGAAWAYLQNTEMARKHFEIARELDPSNTEVYIGLAFVNNGQDRYPYAVKYLLEYIKRAPQPGNGYALLSRVYLNMRVFDKAMAAGQKASEHVSDNPYVWYNLGQAYLYQPSSRYVKEAAEALEKAVSLSPNYANAHFELGRAYARLGKDQDAINSYREAAALQPASGRFKNQLALQLMKAGQREEGSKLLAEASDLLRLNQREAKLKDQLTINPKDTTKLFELSQICKKTGDYGQAVSVLRSLLSVDPDHAQASAELKHLLPLAQRRL
jgi:cytochrome c-type biogenesis protein CcmH/NrfG